MPGRAVLIVVRSAGIQVWIVPPFHPPRKMKKISSHLRGARVEDAVMYVHTARQRPSYMAAHVRDDRGDTMIAIGRWMWAAVQLCMFHLQ